nr:DUF433 domain-containing protein [Nitrosomonas nitrosa]
MENERIVTDDNICAGKAHIKEIAITVEMVLRALAAGEPIEQVLEAYPYLTREDIEACFGYALRLVIDEWQARTGYTDFDPGPIADWNRK